MSPKVRHFYEFGSFRLDADKRRLSCGGHVVPLSPRALDALLVLVHNPGKDIEREELMQAVWADAFVEDANLTVAISNLRKVLGQNGESQEYIETIPRVGYRFVAEVREVVEQPMPLMIERHTLSRTVIEEQTDETNTETTAPAAMDLRKNSRVRKQATIFSHPKFAVAVGVLLLVAVALILYGYLKPRVSAQPTINSVAVLPLKNLTGDPNQEYLTDGLTEGLINSLSRIEGLKVISRSSAFTFKTKESDPREVGNQLRVAAIFEGAIIKNKDLVRVSMRLVSTEDGRVLWASDSPDHSLHDVFAIEDDLALSASKAIRPNLKRGDAAIAKQYTKTPDAYQLYLKGRYFWNKRTEADILSAIDYFQKAIGVDSGYAPAYCGLADSYVLLNYYGTFPTNEMFQKARSAAEKAIELDATLAEPHATLGIVTASDWNWSQAEKEYRLALELNPNYATAHHWYAWYLINVGRPEESVEEMRRALELDPASIAINVDLGLVLEDAYRADEAIERLNMALQMDKRQPGIFSGLALAYELKGNLPQSASELEEAIRLSEGKTYSQASNLARLGRVYALMGQRDRALEILSRLNSMSRENKVPPYWVALVYTGLGDKERALTALESSCQIHDMGGLNGEGSIYFASLRNEPRFQKILACAGLGS
jgi:TolB-like protein/DNA-binding winged helix-turn-helix (wHTH) protein/Tfp pilus assembly protein PilF